MPDLTEHSKCEAEVDKSNRRVRVGARFSAVSARERIFACRASRVRRAGGGQSHGRVAAASAAVRDDDALEEPLRSPRTGSLW